MQKVKTVLEDQKIDLSGGATSLIYQSNVQASPGRIIYILKPMLELKLSSNVLCL